MANMEDDEVATLEHCIHCFDVLLSHFEKSKIPNPAFKNDKYPLFVTWQKHNSKGEPSLRGCKGTFESKYLHTGLSDFALISALKDKRFSPISVAEMHRLECSVSLLYAFEECDHSSDWEVGKHGIIIDFRDPDGSSQYNATYLPEVAAEQEWTKMEALKSLIRKAGFEGSITQEFLSNIKTTRYRSSKSKLHYSEYRTHKNKSTSSNNITPAILNEEFGNNSNDKSNSNNSNTGGKRKLSQKS